MVAVEAEVLLLEQKEVVVLVAVVMGQTHLQTRKTVL
jgi:hypothetical protein